MRYVVTNRDGSVAIVKLMPIAALVHADNNKRAVLKEVRRILPQDAAVGMCVLCGPDLKLVVGNENYDIGDLTPSAVSGFTLEFPDIQRDVIAKWPQKYRSTVVSVRECVKEPVDRSYRNAWVDDGQAIVHDMPKARAIHLTRLRKQRDAALDALDGPWMRAMGQDNKAEAARIEAERQALRDMPVTLAPAIAAAATLDELKAVVHQDTG